MAANESSLAAYAADPAQSRGRTHPEAPHPYRGVFQRDRDRIIHCSAFRRLEYKTQVFAYAQSDYYRSRLTHTLEVTQIARTLARALNLNEDLTEAVALSHDIGHPPFGHAGEAILNERASEAGGFNHNRHGLRIVDVLEKRYARFDGLNLTYEIRESFGKHGSGRAHAPEEFRSSGPQPTLEAQIVDLADEIAYNAHDLDDGLAGSLLDVAHVTSSIDLWAEIRSRVTEDFPDADSAIQRVEIVRRIIDRLVNDAYEHTRARLESHAGQLQSVDDVRKLSDPLVELSPTAEPHHRQIKQYLRDNLYGDYRLVRMARKAERVLGQLFDTFHADPDQLPAGTRRRIERDGKTRAVCDYIAGMTDRFALQEYARLFEPVELKAG